MIHYGRHDITSSDINAVVEVLQSDFLTQGPLVPKYEQAVAAYCKAKHSVAVNSATSALHIACLALGLGKGDWLWTSPITFVASANCGLYCGAQVDFVDIDPVTYNLSIDKLSEKLEQAEVRGLLPKIIIPVHLCGQSCDMKAIHQLSKKYGFNIIEDASHAIGGRYKNESIGNCKYSDITIFSFHPVKIITTGEGGMAMTNNEKLAELMQQYRSHGITGSKEIMHLRPEDEIWNYQQIHLGYNYRMTDIAAALGLSQINRLNEYVIKRQEIAKKYDSELRKLPITIPWQHPDAFSSYHLYPIRINKDKCGKTQRQIYDIFLEHQIWVNIHYIPVYRQPYYEDIGFEAGYCPEAELYHKEVMSLPIYPILDESDQEKVINVLMGALS